MGGGWNVDGRWVEGGWEVGGRWMGGGWKVDGRWVEGGWKVGERWVDGRMSSGSPSGIVAGVQHQGVHATNGVLISGVLGDLAQQVIRRVCGGVVVVVATTSVASVVVEVVDEGVAGTSSAPHSELGAVDVGAHGGVVGAVALSYV